MKTTFTYHIVFIFLYGFTEYVTGKIVIFISEN